MTTHRRIILAMVLTYMVFAALLNSVGALILQSMLAYGVDKQATSILDAFKDLPIAVVSFLVASLLPRWGYRRSMMVGLALVTVACITMPMLNTFWMIKVLLATTGAAFALVKVSVYSMIGVVTDDRQAHASLTSFIEGWFMVGVLAGPWIFGAFIQLQTAPDDPVWTGVYWVFAAVCVGIIGLLHVSKVDESAVSVAAAHTGGSPVALLRLAVVPVVIVFLTAAFLYVLIEQGINTWLPVFNAELLHLSTVTSVQLASLFAAATALGRLGAGVALRHLTWNTLLVLCIVSTALLIVLILPLAKGVQPPAAPGWWNAPLVAFVFPLIGLCMAPIYPSINSVVLSALPRAQHAAMTGLIVVFSALGGTTGSFLTGQLFAHFGGQTAFYLLLIPLGLLLLAVIMLHRRTRTLA